MRRVNDLRLVKVEALTKSLIYHRYLLTSISDLDDEFQRWLDEAHSVGDGARFLGTAGICFYREPRLERGTYCLGGRRRECELVRRRSAWMPGCSLMTVRYPG
jgi:hypothetical protein